MISLYELYAATAYAYSLSSIDNPSFLANSRVWIFSGTKDTTVVSGVVQKTFEYYQHYVPTNNVTFVNNLPAAHAWVTDFYGNTCGYFGSPYINNCAYDAAGKMLEYMYGPLKAKVNATQSVWIKLQYLFYYS